MNEIFDKFLTAISKSDLQAAYYLLDHEFGNPVDVKIAAELKAICTSHFLRQRTGKLNSLSNLSKSGFIPALVFDVGAQIGTPELYSVFPEAHHIFIEPVAECLPALNQIASQLRSATVINCAVSNINGMTSLSLTPSRQYSSIDMEIGGESREIEVRTVDSIYEECTIEGPILLKIDVDGIEVKVLKGSKTVLQRDCVVVIEASMGDENPRFARIVEYLASYDFDVFDIVDPLYRLSDWHLWQVDLVFVKKSSSLWGSRNYA